MRLDDRAVRERMGRIEGLLHEVESLTDERAREVTLETAQALLELYGEGLGRVVALANERGQRELLEALGEDELVAHLLILHGLHPVPLETRVLEALQSVRPYLESHGGDVELVRIEEGVAYLRLQGSCHGCASSTATLRDAIEQAILEAAPDIERIEAEGVAAPGVQPLIFCPDGIRPRAKSAVA